MSAFLYDAPRFGVSPLPASFRFGLPVPGRAPLILVAGLALAFALAGCGRKGPLEPPPGAVNAKANPLEEKEIDPEAPKPVVPAITPVGSKKGKKIEAPKEKFILDPIL
jgi:predicted small lipoprotein YifL